MAATRIRITLDDDQIEGIRSLISERRTANITAFVRHAVKIALYDAAGLWGSWRMPVPNDSTREGTPSLASTACGRDNVSVMAATRISVALDDDQLRQVRALVAAGEADSISAFVKHAVKVAILDAAGWRRALNEALEQTGGPLTDAERAWADSILGLKAPVR